MLKKRSIKIGHPTTKMNEMRMVNRFGNGSRVLGEVKRPGANSEMAVGLKIAIRNSVINSKFTTNNIKYGKRLLMH